MKVKRSNRKLLEAILLVKREASQHNRPRTKKPNSSFVGNAGNEFYRALIGRAIKIHKSEQQGQTGNHRANEGNGTKASISVAPTTEQKRDPEVEASIYEALKQYKQNAWVRRQTGSISITVTEKEILVQGNVDSAITKESVSQCIKDWKRQRRDETPFRNLLSVGSAATQKVVTGRGARDRRTNFARYHNRSKK